MATKPAAKKAPPSKSATPNALQKPLQPSKELGQVIGAGLCSRGQAVSKVWKYIKAHNLQNPKNKREILADDKLRAVFGKPKVTMFEMNKYLARNLRDPA